MIDETELQRLIDHYRSFRIGGRGICINCLRTKDSICWSVSVPRAGMRSLNCDSIEYCPTDNTLVCGVECGYVASFQFDLNMYSKITVIE